MTACPFDCCPTCGHTLWPTDGITPRMRDTMIAIQGYYDLHGVPPSLDEVAALTGAANRSSVHARIKRLEARGYLASTPARARSLTILRRVPEAGEGVAE